MFVYGNYRGIKLLITKKSLKVTICPDKIDFHFIKMVCKIINIEDKMRSDICKLGACLFSFFQQHTQGVKVFIYHSLIHLQNFCVNLCY